MLARAHAFTIEGLHARHVTVEVDVRPGLPAFTIVGLADAGVREARERIRTAILNARFDFPPRRITANLAPGDVRKAGPGLDLVLACAILAASGQLEQGSLERVVLYGELALDGSVRPVRGTLAVAQAARRIDASGLILAPDRAPEARLVEGLRVIAAEHLCSAVRVLKGGAGDSIPVPSVARTDERAGADRLDLIDVTGQAHAVRASVIAAAGGHNLLLSGPPGTGKTMLAQRLPSILPPLDRREAIEVMRIHSVTGASIGSLPTRRPFRSPHHSVTGAGLIGGSGGQLGEVVLAHNGVLFLDELSEFARSSLEALRQPLEDGRVSISRAHRSHVYPARFMLLAATNPCPCGYAGEDERCVCSAADKARHRRRLSGPLLDRIDLLACLQRCRDDDPRGERTSSARARERVAEARARQAKRLVADGVTVNAHMSAGMLRRHVRLEQRGEEMLRTARHGGLLSARGEHRVLRVARTIADLEASGRVRTRDLGAALAMRPDLRFDDVRVA